MVAAARGRADVVPELQRAGASQFLRDNAGNRASDLAYGAAVPVLPAPSLQEQYRYLFSTARIWCTLMASTIAAVGIAWGCTCNDHIDSSSSSSSSSTTPTERPPSGAMLLAAKKTASSTHRHMAKAYRFGEVCCSCVLPMLAMLVVDPKVWLPFLACLFLLPAMLLSRPAGVLPQPLALMLSPTRHSLLRDVGDWRTGSWCSFCLGGLRVLLCVLTACVVYVSPHVVRVDPQVAAASAFVQNDKLEVVLNSWDRRVTVRKTVSEVSLLVVGSVFALVVVGWLITTVVVTLWGLCCKRRRGSQEASQPSDAAQVYRLAREVDHLNAQGDLETLQVKVDVVKVIEFFPPGGLTVTFALLLADFALDASTANTMFLHGDYMFAGAIVTAGLTSTLVALRRGLLQSLAAEFRLSLATGVPTARFRELTGLEAGTEALVSLAVSAYGLAFSVTTTTQLLLGALSMVLSVNGVATLIHEKLDLQLQDEEIEAITAATRSEAEHAALMPGSGITV